MRAAPWHSLDRKLRVNERMARVLSRLICKILMKGRPHAWLLFKCEAQSGAGLALPGSLSFVFLQLLRFSSLDTFKTFYESRKASVVQRCLATWGNFNFAPRPTESRHWKQKMLHAAILSDFSWRYASLWECRLFLVPRTASCSGTSMCPAHCQGQTMWLGSGFQVAASSLHGHAAATTDSAKSAGTRAD